MRRGLPGAELGKPAGCQRAKTFVKNGRRALREGVAAACGRGLSP